MVNNDRQREQLEGVRYDANGTYIPTPCYCCKCKEDAKYGYNLIWYCSEHWWEYFNNQMKGEL